MYPLKLIPAFKDYLWGGRRLKTDYHMQTGLDPVAEAWVLSCHPDGPSTVSNGEFVGKTLPEAIDLMPGCLGTKGAAFEFFPILTKLIDARDNLSIQIHPSDEYALKNEGQYGKTEMWYVLDSAPGAALFYGFKEEISKEEFRRHIENNTLPDVLNKVEAKKGDVLFIGSGTVHAIGAGLLIAEIQQNSNLTYRVYDYGRVGPDGKPRALHIEKALEVANLCPPSNPVKNVTTGRLASCKYFTVDSLEIDTTADFTVDADTFKSLLILDGSGQIQCAGQALDFAPGDSFFFPATIGDVMVEGRSHVLISYV